MASAPYGPLFQELDNLRRRTARFRKVALHLHSPESFDWGRKGHDSAKNDKERFKGEAGAKDFAAELRLHLELAAVTDHMRCGFSSRLFSEGGCNDGFVALPGMEVNFIPEAAVSSARIHLLVIFPEGSGKEKFGRLFLGLPSIPDDDGQRTGNEEVSGIPLKEWVSRVKKEGGICIAAHVDNQQGIRCRFRETARNTVRLFKDDSAENLEREYEVGAVLKDYLFDSGIDGVEITKACSTSHYAWVNSESQTRRRIPAILAFDAHCIEDLQDKNKVTYLKMTGLGFAGLRDALRFPQTRIRFPKDLPSPQNPVVSGIQVIGSKDSFFENLTVSFSENLNCLIGARGSGKSTVVEALRYVFGYNRALNELEKLEKQVRELQAANLTDCLIRVVYKTTDAQTRVLEATFDPKSDYGTKVYTSDGEYLEIPDVEASGEFPLRLYGWSEIELIGRSPPRQRALLDRFIPQLEPVLAQRRDLRQRLRDNRAAVGLAVQEVKSAFEKSNSEIRRFKQYNGDFEKLNTPEVQSLFAKLDDAQARQSVLKKVKANIEQTLNRIGDSSQIDLRAGLDPILRAAGQQLSDWWLGDEISSLGLIAAEQDIQASIRGARQRLETFTQLVDQHITSITHEITNVEQELRNLFTADTSKQKIADLRTNAKKRLQHVSGLRQSYQTCWQALRNVFEQRKGILSELVDAQRKIAGIRAEQNAKVGETLNEFLPESMKVSIHFVAGGDKTEFIEAVEPFLKAAKHYKARNLAQVVVANYDPVDFSRMVGMGQFLAMKGKKATINGDTSEINEDDIAKIAEATNPIGHDDAADVNILADDGERLDRLLDLQEVEWDDFEGILLNNRPVHEMSPGQRSSAMLPLIALAQETPLLIDQPEDNLDKKLLGGVLANVLAHLKEKRQIIVCTHDPNILVSGDAEQVIVLEAISDRKARVGNHGSIDNVDIVQTVIDILEGGKEAFEARNRRYESC